MTSGSMNLGALTLKEVMFPQGDMAMLSINWNLEQSSDDIEQDNFCSEPLGREVRY